MNVKEAVANKHCTAHSLWFAFFMQIICHLQKNKMHID